MPFEMRTSEAGSTLILSGRLGVQQARPLWDAAQAAMAERRPLTVQAGDVEDLDTSIAQILCRVASRSGEFQIGRSSDGFLIALARRGLDRFFVHAADPPMAERVLEPAEEVEKQKIAVKKTKPLKGNKSRG